MSEFIDNRARRIHSLKVIVKQLHEGVSPEQVRGELTDIVKHASAAEVAAMEQQLLADGVSVQQIRSMCDLHAQVVKDLLRNQQTPDVPPGHPADTFHQENLALQGTLGKLRAAIEKLAEIHDAAPFTSLLNDAKRAANDLMDVEKHYARKENLLFSCLERHGINGPSRVMWARDDEARAALKALHEALFAPHASAADVVQATEEAAERVHYCVGGMIDKEENILLPMSLQTLTEDEWGEIWQQSPPYGWCLVEPREGYAPPATVIPPDQLELPRDRSVAFPTGSLTFDQVVALFKTLPVDLTFVDADDRVRFFSETADRVFPRSKVIIGRKVQHCHPPDSVDVVNRILSDFRGGRQDVAQFWINFRGRFVHVRYFAVRGPKREYMGTLEVTQDATPIRALQGERRLLEYDAPPAAQ
ncbi:hypothetical protein RAS1_09870 [Phycisphaerae bacterium RAS1]|nr:hypothetical protein RAS1_09870 [Phycisphaerae bacterium RAS1]